MKVIKAQFKDDAGYYTMMWSYDSEIYEIRDIIEHECRTSKSQFIKFIKYENN